MDRLRFICMETWYLNLWVSGHLSVLQVYFLFAMIFRYTTDLFAVVADTGRYPGFWFKLGFAVISEDGNG